MYMSAFKFYIYVCALNTAFLWSGDALEAQAFVLLLFLVSEC